MAFGQFVLTAKFDCGGVFEQNVVAAWVYRIQALNLSLVFSCFSHWVYHRKKVIGITCGKAA